LNNPFSTQKDAPALQHAENISICSMSRDHYFPRKYDQYPEHNHSDGRSHALRDPQSKPPFDVKYRKAAVRKRSIERREQTCLSIFFLPKVSNSNNISGKRESSSAAGTYAQ
jgi:hypothetical protein